MLLSCVFIMAGFATALCANMAPRNLPGMTKTSILSLDLAHGENMGASTATLNLFTGVVSTFVHSVEEIISLAYHGTEEIISLGLGLPASYFYEASVRTSRRLKNIVRDYRGDYSALLDEAIALSDIYLDPKGNVAWKQTKGASKEGLRDYKGVEAWVAKHPIPTSSKPDGDIQWPVIKASTILRGITPKDLSNLLMDSSRVTEYNEFAVKRVDLEILKSPAKNVQEKVVYMQTRNPFKLKPYDMVSLMRLAPSSKAKGGFRIITKGCEHARAPLNPNYRRSTVIVAVNECLPYREMGRVVGTHITTVTQSRYVSIPKLFLNKMNTIGTLSYLSNLRKYTNKNKN